MKVEVMSTQESKLHMKNFDWKDLKLFALSDEKHMTKAQNILSQSDIRALKKFINSIKKRNNDNEIKSSYNFKSISHFKNFEQLTNDYNIYKNLCENDSSIDYISKAFNFKKSSYNKYKINEKEDITEHEKMTLDLLENTNNYYLEKNNSSNNYNIIFDSIENNPKTTLMIKNIPNKFNKEMLIRMIDKNHKDKYNYFYLPLDVENNCNMGYAFINFAKNHYIKSFFKEFNNKKWNFFHSEKICEIKYARYQSMNYYKNININSKK